MRDGKEIKQTSRQDLAQMGTGFALKVAKKKESRNRSFAAAGENYI
jgi:hypothetical protein